MLPEPAIKALYIIEKSAKLSKDKQIRLLDQSVSFDIVDSRLNDIRNNLLIENKIDFPETLAEVIALLLTTGIVKENSFNYEINYKSNIEVSQIELTKEALEAISYVRSFYYNSENMTNYINSFDIVGHVPVDSDDAHIILVNEFMDAESEPREKVFKATFVYEVSLLREKMKHLLKVEAENEKNFN